MRILLVICAVLVATYVVIWVTRDAWKEPLSDFLAEKVTNAIHDNSPSEPSFIKDFAKLTGKKILKRELSL